jgi:hypothetical protein
VIVGSDRGVGTAARQIAIVDNLIDHVVAKRKGDMIQKFSENYTFHVTTFSAYQLVAT